MAAISVLLWMIFRFVVPLVLLIGIGTWIEQRRFDHK